ncbi:MAG: hypothetical protein EOM92_14830, partial [Gammaproteobacteria bacterium]|nr:hypothetical protein [Gammaproteobacteria bacterium]
MRQYSAEFKASLIAKMLPPHNRPVPDLARETQIPRDTLYSWRTQALKAGGDLVPTPTPDARDSAAKFAIVVETAHLNAEELSAYCRRQGLYPQQIAAWRRARIQANTPVFGQAKRAQRQNLICRDDLTHPTTGSYAAGCFINKARTASLTRVCQPGPLAFNAASRSASKRIVVETFLATAGGRPRRTRGFTAAHSSSVNGRASGSDSAAAVMAASSSGVGSRVPGLRRGIAVDLGTGSLAETDDAPCARAIHED